MLIKVISGGQNGVDQAALRAATRCGVATGGFIPRGFKTLDGPRPELGPHYGLRETFESTYPPRTEFNVINSDATLRIARDFQSRGERCTLKFIEKHDKLHFGVSVLLRDQSPSDVAKWLAENGIRVLNVAGNSEKTAPGIGEWAFEFLVEVFSETTR